jgi:hypothetical protein
MMKTILKLTYHQRPPDDQARTQKTMKKTTTKGRRAASDDLEPEYYFDYRKARPNRFAGRIDKDRVLVVLDPDIAEVFTNGEAVNRVLRALITSMPKPTRARPVRRSTTRS